MKLFTLTKNKMNELINERDKKRDEYNLYTKLTVKELWSKELDEFLNHYNKWYTVMKELDDDMLNMKKTKGKGKGKGKVVDKVVDKVSKKVDKAKDKIAGVRKDVADTAHDISKSVKKAVDLTPRIARRAYELYEQRGRQEGLSVQDWGQAEEEIRRDDIHK